ncbi:GlxA family transcriptional regulator [Pararhodobacter sp. SW119]|uniref:GlxA family transcriptional regulator n=1 Tax=Pararhodobacter sp. SW119 TaxID=2780075 RepID=UPI001ADF5C7B|nr:GlxA family transcriptional regulator [Pararhodobacter sp. SW119]
MEIKYARTLNQRTGQEPPFRVAFLVIPGFSLMALSSAIEPLRSLNRHVGEVRYEWFLIGEAAGTVAASNGLVLQASYGINDAPSADLTVVVASLYIEAFHDRSVFAFLRRVRAQRRLIGAISTGSLLLARAGLLTGRRVTIHWEFGPLLAEEFPGVDVCRALYCRDGDIMTAGGGTAALDMMLDLIASRDGRTAASSVADQFLYGRLRPGDELQRDDVRWRYQLTDRRIEAAIRIMEAALSTPLRIAQIADAANISERQLERLFLTNLGMSPSDFYMDLRLTAARSRLLHSSDTLEEIAVSMGFSSQAHFSRAIKAWCGESPLTLRMRRRQVVGSVQKDVGRP